MKFGTIYPKNYENFKNRKPILLVLIKKSVFDIMNIWSKVFKNGPSKICGRQPLKNLKRYGRPKQTISFQIF